jgi:DNA-binding beta-propeller fold protein YncE
MRKARSEARMGVRGRRLLAALVVAIAATLASSVPADALLQRGHTFSASFGAAFGEGGTDKLSGPTAVAVNEATVGETAGDAYVLDTANNRVVRFAPGPEHKFLEAWGYGVAGGGAIEQQCVSKCGPGLAGFSPGQFDAPTAIAVDNAVGSQSRGDVYVVANRDQKHAVVDKFSAEGKFLGSFGGSKEEKELAEGGIIVGVAVDQNGVVWVAHEEGTEELLVSRFDGSSKNKQIGEPTEIEIEDVPAETYPARAGFAVDASGHVYVTYEPGGKGPEEISEEEEEIQKQEEGRVRGELPQQPCTLHPCLVAELATSEEDGELSAATVTPDLPGLAGTHSTGVAADFGGPGSGDAYVASASSIAAYTSTHALIERFGAGQLKGGSGVAVDGATNEVFVADASSGLVDVYTPAPAAAPVVQAGSVGASHVGASSAELRATIDPTGADTHYRFLYGTTSCAVPISCTEIPSKPGNDIGQGFGDQRASLLLAGLAPSTTYHLRVVAENSFASGDEAVFSPEEATFTTTSSALTAALPDGRAWELVSPIEKHGATISPIGSEFESGLVEAAGDGSALTYMANTAIGENEAEVEGNISPDYSQLLATRRSGGWSTLDIQPPTKQAEGTLVGLPHEYQWFSSDLSEAIVDPRTELPLSAQTTEATPYLRHNTICRSAPASCFEPLVSAADNTAKSKYERLQEPVLGATPDLKHVVIRSTQPLLAGEKKGGLYERTGGALTAISILPDGTHSTAGNLFLGAEEGDALHDPAISSDGTRVVWRESKSGLGHLYMRDTATNETLQVDEPNSGVPAPIDGEPAPDFKGASIDGSRIFFTSNQRLTTDSTIEEFEGPSANKAPRDLYVFEPEQPAGSRLTDLSVDLRGGEAAAVRGGISTSEDGALVYFVANGVLTPDAEPGDCAFAAGGDSGCTLYVSHDDGTGWETQRIAELSAEDNPDWGHQEHEIGEREASYQLKWMTSRASPDGGYFAFMSSRSLTDYNNADANSGAPDEEVFLYKFGPKGSGSLVCASCNPTGAQPVGVHDVKESGEGIGLLVDRTETWQEVATIGDNSWLAGSVPGWTPIGHEAANYQSRYLADSGRLFFNSSDSLVPADGNSGKEDVYEYEPLGVGSCASANTERGCVALISSGESQRESTFLDASENGDDVFFLTNSSLSPLDTDTSNDVYDARVCAVVGVDPCPTYGASPLPPCSSEACKPPPAAQLTYGAPASSASSGTANGQLGAKTTSTKPGSSKPLTAAQKLAAALKKCHKLRQKKKRLACEKQARKKYAPHRAAARKPAGKSSRNGR